MEVCSGSHLSGWKVMAAGVGSLILAVGVGQTNVTKQALTARILITKIGRCNSLRYRKIKDIARHTN